MNECLTQQRIRILESLRKRNQLSTLIDCGANDFMYRQMGYDNIVAIDVDATTPVPEGVELVHGAFEERFLDAQHLKDNTCFTYMYFEFAGAHKPPQIRGNRFLEYMFENRVEKVKHSESVRMALINAGLKNSYLVTWVRSLTGKQECIVCNLETGGIEHVS